MISHNIENWEKRENKIPPSNIGKLEYFSPEIDFNTDELNYINSLPKTGYSRTDHLMHNGEKFSQRVVSEYIVVLMKGNLRILYENTEKLQLRIDDFVIVESEYGLDIGRVCDFGDKTNLKFVQCHKLDISVYKILRIPDLNELKLFNKKMKEESEVLTKSRELVSKYGFEMKVTEACWQFDRQRLTIFFTAPQRIDFRELVKELARLFKVRIELRQISSREETKRLGNFVGPCGRELCCTTFMCSFDHVTLDHARVQQLSNNISKLSGNCGRLKCCIKFEYETYSAAIEKYPPIGSVVEFEGNSLRIIKIDIFNGKITTYDNNSSKYTQHTSQELSEMIQSGKLIIADEEDDSQKFNHFDEDLKSLLE